MKQADSRRSRGDQTRSALKRAAEQLIAERGLAQVNLRDIVAAAGQRNSSALQYHFGSFDGLISDIHRERSAEIREARAALLTALLAANEAPDLRALCELMVRPSLQLAQADEHFRTYVCAFGHELALSSSSPLALAQRGGGGGSSGRQLGLLLRQALSHLDDEAFRHRLEAAVRMCSASMADLCRRRQDLAGRRAERFVAHLIDGLVGLLSAPSTVR